MINWYRALFRRRFGLLQDHRVQAPALLVAGDCDPYLAPATIQLNSSMGQGIRSQVLHGRGHWLIDEDPTAAGEIITSFLGQGPAMGGEAGQQTLRAAAKSGGH
jgi:pimeloyl-ACP methyl ester carboxylesterase